MAIWDSILDVFRAALEALHGALDPVFGVNAWGWAIIALTVVVRLLLLPLAIKQTRSMRAMQAVQPKVKALQQKYKVDRDLLRKDPERYRAQKAKLNEEMMALYKEEGVNPASGCLPLLLQAPIFLALFRVLNDFEPLKNAPFYFFTDAVSGPASGLGATVREAGWPGWLLIVLMAGTMFWSQRQMMARNQPAEGAQAQQQKILMYVMPVFLAFISLNFPLGVLLYWVTTNVWQMGQQAVILREVQHEVDQQVSAATPERKGRSSDRGAGGATAAGTGQASSKTSGNGRAPRGGAKKPSGGAKKPSGGGKKPSGGGKKPSGGGKKAKNRDHTPRRDDRG